MTRVRLANRGDHAQWDDYVLAKERVTPYHTIAWKLAVEAAYGHRGHYLLAEDGGRIEGVLPLFLLCPPLLGNTLCSLPFCDVGGCLADDDDIRGQLLSEAFALARNTAAAKVEIREDAAADAETPLPGQFEHAPKVSMTLPLPENSQALLAGFKSKLRSQIKKAEKNGLTFSNGAGEQGIDAFFHVFSRNMKQLGSPVHAKRWFQAVQQHFGDNMLLGLVSMDSTVVGAGIVLIAAGKAYIPWASTLSAFNRYAPNMLLYWHLLQQSCDAGCKSFDFGRSTLGEGTFRFKKQWGATPAVLQWQTYDPQGQLLEAGDSGGGGGARRVIENVWRRLPLSLTVGLGPPLRKYITL